MGMNIVITSVCMMRMIRNKKGEIKNNEYNNKKSANIGLILKGSAVKYVAPAEKMSNKI